MKKLDYSPDSHNSLFGKIRNWIEYRNAVYRAMRAEVAEETLFWFGTAESAIPLFPLLKKRYMVMSVLELMDTRRTLRYLSASIARKCVAVTACEETRANIMKYWWRLKETPYVIPNKPYDIDIVTNAAPSSDETAAALAQIGGRPFIIYQGIFQNIEYISQIATALSNRPDKPLLVMMGSDRRSIYPIIKEIYPETLFIPHIQSPNHLEITSHGLIGIVCYDHTSLNKLYCAPNKIFEYSKFGIPMLANDVPGLKESVGAFRAGVCVNFDSLEDVASGIESLLANHEYYSRNALEFYESVDNRATIEKLIKEATSQ